MTNNTPQDLPSTYLECYSDFRDRVDPALLNQTKVFSFEQTWASTTCGHGGIGGQAVTSAQTYVFNVQTGKWYVYQGGQFSYAVENPTDQFYDDLRDWNLVGEIEFEDVEYDRNQ